MRIVAYIIVGIVGLYLLLVIPAGIAVLISERRFKKAPKRDAILEIIRLYQADIRGWPRDQITALAKHSRREGVEKEGVLFSVDLSAKELEKDTRYRVTVSVGKLHLVTLGHAESIEVLFSK